MEKAPGRLAGGEESDEVFKGTGKMGSQICRRNGRSLADRRIRDDRETVSFEAEVKVQSSSLGRSGPSDEIAIRRPVRPQRALEHAVEAIGPRERRAVHEEKRLEIVFAGCHSFIPSAQTKVSG